MARHVPTKIDTDAPHLFRAMAMGTAIAVMTAAMLVWFPFVRF